MHCHSEPFLFFVIPSEVEESKDLSTTLKVTRKYHAARSSFVVSSEVICYIVIPSEVEESKDLSTTLKVTVAPHVISSEVEKSKPIKKAPFSKGSCRR